MASTSFARNKFEGLIYVIGDETTKNGVRLLIEDGKIVAVEKRQSGVWNSWRLSIGLNEDTLNRILIDSPGNVISDEQGEMILTGGTSN